MGLLILLQVLFFTICSNAQYQNATCPPHFRPTNSESCAPFQGANVTFPPQSPSDYSVIGPPLQAIHSSITAPTGFAVDSKLNVYLTYPRNGSPSPVNVAIATSWSGEEPWPNAAIQNCTARQNVSECFINVQNVVLDSLNQMWVIDSGIFPGNASATPNGAKIIAFDTETRKAKRTYTIPESLFYDNMNLNDLRINNTLGTGGFAFIPDASALGSILTVDLDTGAVLRRLHNTTYVKPDEKYVGVFNGQPLFGWNGTTRTYASLGADGIALQSGNVYWGDLASRRFYYISQSLLVDPKKSEAEVEAGVVFPSQISTEQAGFTADDKGRVFVCASEHNAIFYFDTLQSRVTEEINGTPPGGQGLVKPDNYIVKTLVRSALIQHADSAAIWDGWLYFCTNQLELSPRFQYRNVDKRKGPFVSYRVWIGAGPAI